MIYMITFLIFNALNRIIIGQMFHKCINGVDEIKYVRNGKLRMENKSVNVRTVGKPPSPF